LDRTWEAGVEKTVIPPQHEVKKEEEKIDLVE